MTEREVRFTEQFFDQLELLLPTERAPDGTPSITDFLLIDLPNVRDQLWADFERYTLATNDSDVRVLIAAGMLVPRFAVFASLQADVVEVFWITIDT